MESDINGRRFYVGIKQSTEAVAEGLAKRAIVARDADSHVKEPFLELCAEKGVPLEFYDTKQELGRAFGIDVGAACVVML